MTQETEASVWGPQPPSFKRRAAIALFGENAALNMAARYVDFRVRGEHTFTAAGRMDYAHIRKFKNVHAGGRCVIMGNGPSLRETDLSLLRNEVTFGLNRIYLMFDTLGFEPTYHVVVNKHVVEQCAEDLRQIKVPLFTTTENRDYLRGAENARYLTPLSGPRFATNAAHGIWVGGTVTYVTMQLAYYMGFTEVVLVGVDHRYGVTGPGWKTVVATEADQNHFDPNYFGPGFRWQLPDLETSEISYRLARRKFQESGRRIVDSTVGGALEVFPKMSLADALAT